MVRGNSVIIIFKKREEIVGREIRFVLVWFRAGDGGGFFFFIFKKKIKISKIYVHFKKIQKYPTIAPHRATGPKCNFFSLNLQRGTWKKGGLSHTSGATVVCRPLGGDRVPSPYINPGRHSPPFLLSFEAKNSGKKRGVRRRKAAKLCRIAYL